MARIVCVGEGMFELSQRDGHWEMHYGGDALNTAIHLARLGHKVAYLTASGSDAISRRLVADWAAEGLDTSLIVEHPTRQPGLYVISVNDMGERSFSYWRDTSAARELFSVMDAALWRKASEGVDLLHFSLISLAILPPSGRRALLMLAQMVKDGGGKVSFDGNYRPRLWASPSEARTWRDLAISEAQIGLPTLEDELAMSSAVACGMDCAAVTAHWQSLGCSEVVVKLGVEGVQLPGGKRQSPPELVKPVDTSGAGDAFNAGYLSARLNGVEVDGAAGTGQRLAAWTIMRAGAIPAADT